MKRLRRLALGVAGALLIGGFTSGAQAQQAITLHGAVRRTLRPVYSKHPGWTEDVSQVRKFSDLPRNAQLYVAALRSIADQLQEVVDGGEVDDPTMEGEHIKVRVTANQMETAATKFAALATKAEKALEDGVDGLILVCAGAGGHAGTLSPFALVGEVRRFYDGPIILSGAISSGADVAAAVDEQVVPRSRWTAHALAEGARILVIRAAQGG